MIHCPPRLIDRVVGFEYKSLSSVMGGEGNTRSIIVTLLLQINRRV